MKPIEYIADWAVPYYLSARYDLGNSGLPEKFMPTTELSKDTPWWDMPGLKVLDAMTERIAALYDVDPKQVVLANGASGGLFLTAFVMSQSRKPVVVETPVYEPIWRDFEALGIEIRWLERSREDKYSLEPLIDEAAKLTKDASCLVITNPNNPTGQYNNRETIAELAKAIKPAYLVVNEAYQPLVEGTSSVWGAAENIIIMQTLTKCYAVCMPRGGWIVVPDELADDFFHANIYVVGNFSASAAAVCIPIIEHLDEFKIKAKAHMNGRHDDVDNAVSNHPRLSWIRPEGEVILSSIKIDGVTDDLSFAKAILKEREVILAPGKFFHEPGTLRMGIGALPENFDEAFNRLLEFSEGYIDKTKRK